MICIKCGGKEAVTRHESRTYGEWEQLLVIENIPVVYCPDCNESYISPDTERELERLRKLYDPEGQSAIQTIRFPNPQ